MAKIDAYDEEAQDAQQVDQVQKERKISPGKRGFPRYTFYLYRVFLLATVLIVFSVASSGLLLR